MACYMIGYDLVKPGRDYSDLTKAITDNFPTYWHHLDSTWLVKSAMSSGEIRDLLGAYIDSNDRLLVATVSAPASWRGIPQSGTDWLKNNL